MKQGFVYTKGGRFVAGRYKSPSPLRACITNKTRSQLGKLHQRESVNKKHVKLSCRVLYTTIFLIHCHVKCFQGNLNKFATQ